jgi:hypothetical protein
MAEAGAVKKDDTGGGDGGAATAAAAAAAAAAGGGDKGTKGTTTDGNVVWGADWRQQFAGEDKKLLARLERYDGPRSVVNALLASQDKIRSGQLRSVLPKDAKPEEITAWRAEAGIPAKWEEYALDAVDKDFLKANKPIVDGFLQTMHKINARPEEVSEILTWYQDDLRRRVDEMHAQDNKFKTEAEDALRVEWGADYRPNLNMIENLLATAPKGVAEQIKGARLANGKPFVSDPDTLRWLNLIERERNPAATITPRQGGDLDQTIETELAGIQKVMRENRKAYNKDEKMQARYRELVDVKAGLDAKRKAAGGA